MGKEPLRNESVSGDGEYTQHILSTLKIGLIHLFHTFK